MALSCLVFLSPNEKLALRGWVRFRLKIGKACWVRLEKTWVLWMDWDTGMGEGRLGGRGGGTHEEVPKICVRNKGISFLSWHSVERCSHHTLDRPQSHWLLGKQQTWSRWSHQLDLQNQSFSIFTQLPQLLKAVDTIGNCQRLAFAVGVSQHICIK